MMIPEKKLINNRQIFLMVLAGTMVRLFYGWYGQFWMSAPDQLAWDGSLNDILHSGTLSYKQLIHYPHEGGSILISIVALICKLFDNWLPALSVSALLIDGVSRWIQLRLSTVIFNDTTAVWFGLWSIISAPLLLPWGTVNFGLHSLSAFWPFVFLFSFCVLKKQEGWGIINGLLTAFAISFSYDSFIFIPVFFIGCLFIEENIQFKLKQCAFFILALAGGLLPHFLLRTCADNGFHLEQLSSFGVRGVDWSVVTISHFSENIISIWSKQLPSSVFMSTELVPEKFSRMFLLSSIIIILLISIFHRKQLKTSYSMGVLFIVVFTLFLAAGPFYNEYREKSAYVAYRYFTYIVPLLFAMIFYMIQMAGSYNRIFSGIFLIICALLTFIHISEIKPERNLSYEAAGWVLARKYGEDPAVLQRMTDQIKLPARKELVKGYGWGLAAVLLEGKSEKDTGSVVQLEQLVQKFDPSDRNMMKEGIEKAFAPGITPVLDPELLIYFHQHGTGNP